MSDIDINFKIRLSWWRQRNNIIFAAILTALPFFLLYPLLYRGEVGIWVIGALLAVAAVYWLTIIYRHGRSYLFQTGSQLVYRAQIGLFKKKLLTVDWSLINQLEIGRKNITGHGTLLITRTNKPKKLALTAIPRISYIFSLLQQHLERQKSALAIVDHLRRKLGEDKFAELIADLDQNVL